MNIIMENLRRAFFPSTSLDELVVSGDYDTGKILKKLRKYGVVVIPEFLVEEKLEELKKEFIAIINSENDNTITPIDYSTGKAAYLDQVLFDLNDFPITKEFFNGSLQRNLCKEILGDDCYINHQIYCVQDIPTTKHIAQDLHIDRTQTLKFFIYLLDTDEKNGAFKCVPRSHSITSRFSNKFDLQEGVRCSLDFSREITKGYEDKAISINAKKGSLIIFLTDVFHQAGKVYEGERLAMRGHSRKRADVKLKAYRDKNL